jgi:hypothetical protein
MLGSTILEPPGRVYFVERYQGDRPGTAELATDHPKWADRRSAAAAW